MTMQTSTETGGPVVSVSDVHKVYHLGKPSTVLDGVTFDLSSGSFTAVMGPSGSGKSTLLNLIGCLDTPTAGSICINGRDVTTVTVRERTAIRGSEIGIVFQAFNLMPKLTAIENVALPLVFQHRPRDERRERARALLRQVELEEWADHRPSELSGGQRQRVAIARALVTDPVILLADEPTGSLDSETGDRIVAMFYQLHDAGRTILLVTHERRIAEHAERIIHMLDGRIESIETVGDRRRVNHELTDGEESWTR